jgi:spermidine synthase
VIARTIGEVFPQVTVWRGEFSSTGPTVGLVAWSQPTFLDPEILRTRLLETRDPGWLIPLEDEEDEAPGPRQTAPFFLAYCGNLTEAKELWSQAPVNTDDRPVIEYQAPITHRRAGSKQTTMLVNTSLLQLLEDLRAAVPTDGDPYLAHLSPKERGYVAAGFLIQKGRILQQAGREVEAQAAREELRQVLVSIARMPG